MEEDNKVFHQAKAEVWEKLAVIEQLMRNLKLGRDDEVNPIFDIEPTRRDLRVLINDLQNRVTKEIRNSNVFFPDQADSSDFPVMTKSYDGEPLFEKRG